MANRFWVGGTGTWDNATTTHWAATTGGAGGASVPAATDLVIFDGSSGAGTVSVNATINGTNTLSSIDISAYTGTLDFSTGNPSITLTGNGMLISGTTTRTINLGSGTFTLTNANATTWGAATITGLTFNAGTSTIVMQPNFFSGPAIFATGGLTYNNVTLGGVSFATAISVTGNGATFANLNISGPVRVTLPSATITNAVNWAGTSANLLEIINATSGTVATLTMSAAGGTASWAALAGITFATNSITASNSFNLGNVTNATITNPSVGGGAGAVIGS